VATSTAKTVDEYMAALPADRRAALTTLREVINANLPKGYEEDMQFGMPGWYIPLSRYPDTYNGHPLGIAGFASQKQYMALYLLTVYGDPKLEKWFKAAYAKSGKKLDMGKSCLRFKSIEDLPLDVIAETIRKVSVEDYIGNYEATRKKTGKSASARTTRELKSKKLAKSSPKKKPAAKTRRK
jgi:uncharacterized protein YdhG (YjbR/CyaY superfamily)